jgi:hypothetical protein
VEKKEKMQMTTQVRLQLTLNTKERVTHKKNLGIKPITSTQVFLVEADHIIGKKDRCYA